MVRAVTTRKLKRAKAQDVAAWAAARAAGRSNREIAEQFDVDEKTVRNHLGPASAPLPVAPAEVRSTEDPPEDVDASEGLLEGEGEAVGPDELRLLVSRELRDARAAKRRAEAAGDLAEARQQKKWISIFVAQLRQIHRQADEDTETIRLRAGDIDAAAERAVQGLQQTAEGVLADLTRWDGGAFGGGDVSVVRALFERVARAGIEAGRRAG
jgi:predicted transcriptional regulator